MQTSWFLLRMALFEEFGEGYVMRFLKKLCKEWWQVPDFHEALDKAWKVYEQVSFFRQYFLQFLKCMMLEMHAQVQLEWAQAQSKKEVARRVFVSAEPMKEGVDASPMNYLSADDAVDVMLGDSSYVGCAYVHDEGVAMTCEACPKEARARSTTQICSKSLDDVLPRVNFSFLFNYTKGVDKVPNQDNKKIEDMVEEVPTISMVLNKPYNQDTTIFIEDIPSVAITDDESIADENVEEEALVNEDATMYDKESKGTDFDADFEEDNLNDDAAHGQDTLKQDFEVHANLDEGMHDIYNEEQVHWIRDEDFLLLEVEEKEDDFLLVAIPSSKYRPLEDLIKEWCMKVLLSLMMSVAVQHVTKIQMCLCGVVLYNDLNAEQVFDSMEDKDDVFEDQVVSNEADLQSKQDSLDGILKQWGSNVVMHLLLKLASLFASRVSLCILGAYFWQPIFQDNSSGNDDSTFILFEEQEFGDEEYSMGLCLPWWIVFLAGFTWFMRLIFWATYSWPFDPGGHAQDFASTA